jgi:hypothetical protein
MRGTMFGSGSPTPPAVPGLLGESRLFDPVAVWENDFTHDVGQWRSRGTVAGVLATDVGTVSLQTGAGTQAGDYSAFVLGTGNALTGNWGPALGWEDLYTYRDRDSGAVRLRQFQIGMRVRMPVNTARGFWFGLLPVQGASYNHEARLDSGAIPWAMDDTNNPGNPIAANSNGVGVLMRKLVGAGQPIRYSAQAYDGTLEAPLAAFEGDMVPTADIFATNAYTLIAEFDGVSRLHFYAQKARGAQGAKRYATQSVDVSAHTPFDLSEVQLVVGVVQSGATPDFISVDWIRAACVTGNLRQF